jgi:hypothetical protein
VSWSLGKAVFTLQLDNDNCNGRYNPQVFPSVFIRLSPAGSFMAD